MKPHRRTTPTPPAATLPTRVGGRVTIIILLLIHAACATVDPTPDYHRAAEQIRDTTGVDHARPADQQPPDASEIDALLTDDLAVDDAVRIALLTSRPLHEQFAGIGIARADWVQSGLLRNPTVGVAVLLPEGGGRSLIEAAVAQQIADLWRIPLRREAAEREVDAAVLQTARLAGEIASRVRHAYYEALAADERAALAGADLDLVHEALRATRRAREIGHVTELDERLARLRVFNTEATLAEARQAADRARQELAYRMGLDRMIDDLALISPWPTWEQPADDEALIRLAREQRPDLHAAARRAEAEGARITLERRRSLPGIALGAELHRPERGPAEGDGIDLLLGPAVSTEIPLFDQNQAQIARAEYEQVAAISVYEQLHLRVAHEVRQAASDARRSAERATRYADDALAEASASVEQARRAHDAGHIDRLTLIETRRTRLQARRVHLSARLDASRGLINLESALGGPLR